MKFLFFLFGATILTCSGMVAQPRIPYGNNPQVGKYADINGIKMYYEVYGQGQPLLLLNGNGGSIRSRSQEIPVLAEKYQVIGVDSRCHGKTGCMAGDLNYEMMTDDVAALLDHLKIDSCLIWGQSDGGIMALIMGYRFPHKVKKMIVTGANVLPDTSAIFPDIYNMMLEYPAIPDSMQRKHTKLLVDHPHISGEQLGQIKAPVMVMAGDRDAIRPEHTLRIFESIPNSQMCILPGATHFLVREKPQLFQAILADFFEKPFQMPSTVEIMNRIAEQQKQRQQKNKP
ncbi:alpha/beta fold hydrolase [Haliscomenobacter hydrossis]|uniref:Alpha/beta hydrolase fold protein n=1 Tax=Haliscomenobacter hydrossis (strain ATCC 27775 / DSM 1100 / LMG 10767 / O) TaxID=760192 RepID=F4KZW3_HALH1|nr:alpha/beta hydrolase [Haliscomenobacter hydrossis]AEE51533.1 alpha/beta hydrolase fold protein [Haliscomenobacter hydrossis DSM 1100]